MKLQVRIKERNNLRKKDETQLRIKEKILKDTRNYK